MEKRSDEFPNEPKARNVKRTTDKDTEKERGQEAGYTGEEDLPTLGKDEEGDASF